MQGEHVILDSNDVKVEEPLNIRLSRGELVCQVVDC
jgi:hypothetical protein